MNVRVIIMVIAAFALGLVLGLALSPSAGTQNPPAGWYSLVDSTLHDSSRIALVDTVYLRGRTRIVEVPSALVSPHDRLTFPDDLSNTEQMPEFHGPFDLNLDSLIEADTVLVRPARMPNGQRCDIIDTIGVQYWQRTRSLGLVTRPLLIPIDIDSIRHAFTPAADASRSWYWDAALVGAGIIIPLLAKFFLP